MIFLSVDEDDSMIPLNGDFYEILVNSKTDASRSRPLPRSCVNGYIFGGRALMSLDFRCFQLAAVSIYALNFPRRIILPISLLAMPRSRTPH